MSHLHDVVIVGAGPIGLGLARLLGRHGHDVLVIERYAEPYAKPRAVVFDDEIGRVLQDMGLADEARSISGQVPDNYEWRNRDGETLLAIDWSGTGPSGWPTVSFFSQPELERVLEQSLVELPSVTVRRASEVVALEEHDEFVEITSTSRNAKHHTTRARYVIGCDGANSFVRQRMGTPVHDEGFFFDWLIVDAVEKDETTWSPQNWQLCDPARPTTLVSGGPGRRRWEFMRLEGESRESLNSLERAWELMEPWGRHPGNTEIERHTMYTFAARWAEEWCTGRLLIAGDAAHQMPPFAGQGMCSGMRDVANLSWKLDRVLRGESGPELLQTYTTERKQHVQYAIEMSMALGKVICVLDEDRAAERDARMIAGGGNPAVVLPVAAVPVLGEGVLAEGRGAGPLVGSPAPQPITQIDGRTGPLDDVLRALFDVTGEPPALLVATRDVPADAVSTEALASADAHRFTIGVDLGDPDGVWASWLDANGVCAVLIRPDHYVFGQASDPAEVDSLVADYIRRLTAASAAVPGVPTPA